MLDEVLRLPAPGPAPMGLALDGPTLWIASREAHRLYAIDSATWNVVEEVQTPGAPFGLTVVGDQLRVVIGLGDDDDERYIYRFIPGHGFKSDRIECPELSGAFVAFDGDTLFLSQAHNRRILALDAKGEILREIGLERVPVGMTIHEGAFYLVTGDPDFVDLRITKVDARGETPAFTTLASIPFVARGLAFDGTRFWTAARDANEIVALTVGNSGPA